MSLNRRDFLLFLGAGLGSATLGNLPNSALPNPASAATGKGFNPGFSPIKPPLPLASSNLTPAQQIAAFSQYEVVDDLVLPSGFIYDVIAAWGDPVGDSRFGYNNDYLALIEHSHDAGYLAVNFEYISAVPWFQTYATVVGKSLPLKDVQTAVQAANRDLAEGQVPGLNAFALADGDPLKAKITLICKEGLIDQGCGVISVRRAANGQWVRTYSKTDRRITGISGLEDGRYLRATGPATAVFRKTKGQGYIDTLGDRIIGTFQNCAGGTTPWGTVLSAEENFQVHVPEPVYGDGTSFAPASRPFNISGEELAGLGNVLGLAGNKYGWMVEYDPANPNDYGTKHTWLGRFRHEAVGVRVVAGKPLAVYSGCDRRGGHLYKFVSTGTVTNPKAKANSTLLTDGMLYAAQFNSDGTGRWIPLTASTAVDPTPPTFLSGSMLPLPQRPTGGTFRAEADEEIEAFKQAFKTLGDLYTGDPEARQGAILIDAHYAANAVGATCTARPEDTEIAPDGSLYIAFTSGAIGRDDGSPDIRIFKGPDGSTAYEFGWIMRLLETKNDPAATTFRWEMVATGGEPAEAGAGFANPDNLAFDPKDNLWMVTDMSSGVLNREVPQNRLEQNGRAVNSANLRGIFGNNSLWCLPRSGKTVGQPFLFGIGPMDCELTGPWFGSDDKTLWLSVQHPGEIDGMRQGRAIATRQFALRTTDGKEFIQSRQIPIGSNWPGKMLNDPPKPAVVVIRRRNNATITA